MNGPATEMLTRSMYRMNAIRQRLNSVRWRIFMGELISDTVPPKRRIGFQTDRKGFHTFFWPRHLHHTQSRTLRRLSPSRPVPQQRQAAAEIETARRSGSK